MQSASLFASITVIVIGALWGLYWLPLRALDDITKAGPWLTFAVLVPACVVLAPAAWRAHRRHPAISKRGIASVALGGASFALYSTGLLYGQVAVVILLFYLTPVWSTLIARFVLGWPITGRRYGAIACGLIGIALVLYASYGELPVPHTLGDWLGLISGILWTLASTGMYTHSRTGPMATNFVFCVGATVTALIMALVLADNTALPQLALTAYAEALGWILLIGGLWWALALAALMWATQMLRPARVGILLLSEAIVGAISAALFAAEPFGPLMITGTTLVVAAGVLETIPNRRVARVKRDSHE